MFFFFTHATLGLHSDVSMEGSSFDNTSSSHATEIGSENKFKRGMLSSVADELVHIIMNLDAIQFKTMFEQTRNVVIEQEDELKKRQDRVMDLESKVRF